MNFNDFQDILRGFLGALFLGTILIGVLTTLIYLIFRPLILWYWKIKQSIINQERTIYILMKLHKQMGGELSDKEFEYLFYNPDITLIDIADEANSKFADNNQGNDNLGN